MWGTNIQRMISLHQVQRMRVQYFSHSNKIQQTVQVGARLANGTHQTGYMQLHYCTRGILLNQLRWQDTMLRKLCKTRTFISTSYQMHYFKALIVAPYIYLHSSYRLLRYKYSVTGCGGSQTNSSCSKCLKVALNSLIVWLWAGSLCSSSRYLRSSCCLLLWYLTVWWLFWRSYFH